MRRALFFVCFGLMHTRMRSIRNSGDEEELELDGTDRIEGQTTLQGFESLVGTLATKVAHQGYNMTTVESQALNTIKNYLQKLFNETQQQHQQDLVLLNQSRQQIIDCETEVEKVKATNKGMQKTMNDSRVVHNSCRETEKVKYGSKKNACAAWDTARNAVTDADMACVCPSFTKDGFHNDQSSTKDCLRTTGATISDLLAAHLLCLNKTNEHSDQTTSCGTKQRNFEQHYCAWSLQNNDVCTTYRTCRPQKIAERNQTHDQVKTRVAARKADYEAGKRTLCLFDVFTAADNEKVAKLQTCTDLSVNTSHLTMTYPGIPPQDNFHCAPSNYAPCDTTWVQNEYTVQSWYHANQTVPATCVPCPTPPTTTITTTQAGGGVLMSNADVKLRKGNLDAQWNAGMKPSSSSLEQVWNLRKCSSTDGAVCLGNDAAWSAAAAVTSGDVVAWLNKGSQKVHDCSGVHCSLQAFPPPTGHWGTPFKIIKVDGSGNPASVGSSINKGDTVYFYGQRGINIWDTTWIINCDTSKCGGGHSNTITGSTFTIV